MTQINFAKECGATLGAVNKILEHKNDTRTIGGGGGEKENVEGRGRQQEEMNLF